MKRLFSTALFAVTALFASVSHGAIVTINLSGTIGDIVDSAFESTTNPYAGTLNIGEQWNAVYQIDTNSPATPTSGLGSHNGAVLWSSVNFVTSGVVFDLSRSGYVHIDAPDSEYVNLGNRSNTSIGGDSSHLVNFSIFEWVGSGVSSLSDLSTNFSLSNFENYRFSITAGSGPTHRVVLDTTSAVVSQVVPIPAGVWLFGSAIAGLIGFRAKRA